MTTNDLRAALRALGEPPSSIDYLLSRNPTPSAAAVTPADALPVAVDGVDLPDPLLRAFIDDDIVDGNAPALPPNNRTGD